MTTRRSPSFTAPNVSENTDIEFTLTVSDGIITVSDSVVITITDGVNTAPTAEVGTDREIAEGGTVTLAGIAADDDPEDDLKYSWSHNSTLLISLDDSTLTPSFTAPNVSENTDIEFTLTVSDGIITVSDSVVITITDSVNTAPTAEVGTDREIAEGGTVTLAGIAADDDPEDDLKYSWSHNSTLLISLDDSTLTPSFTAPNVSENTDIEFTLTVSDGIITVSDSVVITITDSVNTAPTAEVGTDREIAEGGTVTLAGIAADDDPEDDLKYSWSHNSTLLISLDDSTLTPSFTAPNVSENTDIEFTLTVSDGIITVSDSVVITITDSVNTAPTAEVGTDREIAEGGTVTLAGIAADDDPEDDLKYSWSHNSTLLISLDDSTLTPSFTAPNVSENTDIEFTLTVSDGIITVSDSVVITITDSVNTAPTAEVGTDREIAEGGTVTLAGIAADDDPEDDLKYSWSHNSTLLISLDDSTLTPSFTAPNVSENTDIEFTLTVSDGIITVSDSVVITITDGVNTAPTAEVGTDREIAEGGTVTLAGIAADDDPEDDLKYSWSHNSTLLISLDDSTLTPSFTAPNVSENTDIEFTLTVSDGIITVSDSVVITITDSVNTAPTAEVGTDREIAEGGTVTLAGIAADDDPEDDLKYSWSHNSTLLISLDDSTLTPSFTAPNVSENTDIEFTLTVSDGIITVSDSVVITITDSVNTAPTAEVGTDREIAEGGTVTLAGIAADDDPEDDLKYSWSHNSTLLISLDDSTLTPSFTAPNVSENTDIEFTLTVSDGIITVSDSVVITITDSVNTAPTAEVGTDREIAEGGTVTLAGIAADDDPEDDLKYSWSHNSTLLISLDDSTLTPSFTAPNVSENTDIEFTLTVSDGIITVSDSVVITITDSVNTAPTAEVGTDREIAEGGTVTLAGIAADDDPEDDLKYSWSHNSTLLISLDDSTLTPSFTAPNVSENTDIEFTLTVSDGIITVSDSVVITITDSVNTAPTAEVGTDREIAEGGTVTLAGIAADDDPEDDLKYSWSHNSTLLISLDDSTLTPSFTAPNVSENTDIEFTLTVSDGIITVSDSVVITITDGVNTAPTAEVGTDREIAEGGTVTLAGIAADDDPEDDLKYSWSHNSTLLISLDDSTLTPSFTAPNVSENTDIEFTLTVSDGIITVSDSVVITITDSVNGSDRGGRNRSGDRRRRYRNPCRYPQMMIRRTT